MAGYYWRLGLRTVSIGVCEVYILASNDHQRPFLLRFPHGGSGSFCVYFIHNKCSEISKAALELHFAAVWIKSDERSTHPQ